MYYSFDGLSPTPLKSPIMRPFLTYFYSRFKDKRLPFFHSRNNMNIFKKIALSIAVVGAFATVSAPAFAAEEHQDKNAIVKAAAALTITKVNEAISIADGNGDKAAFVAAIGEARQAQKEFRYEQTERLRQKLNDKLRAARESADSSMSEAGAAAKGAAEILKEMSQIYDAAHK
jgi:hypothetical protein